MAKNTRPAPAQSTAVAKLPDGDRVDPKTGEIVARFGSEPAPADLAEFLEAGGGRGVSTRPEDNIIPLLRVLQTNSPQVKPRDPAQIEGAVAGDFWFRESGIPPIPGEDGILVQSVHFSKAWVEWRPNRGGYVTQHLDAPPDAHEVEEIGDDGEPRMVWKRANGNILVETRYHFIIWEGRTIVLPFTSSGHTTSRTWMGMMNGHKTKTGRSVDSWARKYHLTTIVRQKGPHSWFAIKVEDLGWVTTEEYKLGQRVYEEIMAGEKVAATPDDDDAPFAGRSAMVDDAEVM